MKDTNREILIFFVIYLSGALSTLLLIFFNDNLLFIIIKYLVLIGLFLVSEYLYVKFIIKRW